MDFIYHEPEDHSVQWQLEDIRSLIREGVDYLVIVPADLSALTPVLQDAKDAGIPVILIDQSAETIDQSYYVSLISADYLKEGQICAGLLADKFGEQPCRIVKSTAPRAHPEPRRAQKDSIRLL
ncbi:MAG: substrate-binding domain-containing protein [Enterocloster sp.]